MAACDILNLFLRIFTIFLKLMEHGAVLPPFMPQLVNVLEALRWFLLDFPSQNTINFSRNLAPSLPHAPMQLTHGLFVRLVHQLCFPSMVQFSFNGMVCLSGLLISCAFLQWYSLSDLFIICVFLQWYSFLSMVQLVDQLCFPSMVWFSFNGTACMSGLLISCVFLQWYHV